MHVDQKPSPWPCVAMLVGLLLLCVSAPLYWRSDEPSTEMNTDSFVNYGGQEPRGVAEFSFIRELKPRFGKIPGPSSENDLLSLWAPPTLEQLISARAGFMPVDEAAIAWPTFALQETAVGSDAANRSKSAYEPGPRVAAAFQHVGRLIVSYSPNAVVPQLCANAVRAYEVWSAEQIDGEFDRAAGISTDVAPSRSRSSLRLVSPGGRFVQREPITALQDNTSESNPWCAPQILVNQLRRLTMHPYSAGWAERAIADVHAITNRERLEGNDVQPILAELNDLTRDAIRMADETSDDRLRVELLRAHWGLARRLDAWAVMHEIRVASRAQDRVAARGSLGAYFGGPPAETLEPVDRSALSINLETYERTRDPQLARQVVREQAALAGSADSLDRALADTVEQHYRNANIRIAITAEMLNRFVDEERSDIRTLRDNIAGTPIWGRSHTLSESRVVLDPVTGRWQVTVVADGVVDSNTTADGGQARLRSRSATEFNARKLVVVNPEGVQMQPTIVNATARNRLVGVTTDFDWVPVLGSYARDRARQVYRSRQARTRSEVEFKVSTQAGDQIDRDTRNAVERIERQIRDRFTNQLAEAGVDLTPVEMTTTQERVVARLRVAGDHQFGSHTPRPRALSDSLASLQVHETALTNAGVALDLDAGSFTGPELQSMFREKFPSMAQENASARQDAVFHFADEDAIQFHINDGRLEITLSMAGVEQDGRDMRNFVVHAYYVPAVNGLEAALVRDGSLGIEGRLSSSERARLHNVFNSVLPPERQLPIVRLDNPSDPRLAELMVTQLVLEDGWLGLAVGPTSTDRVAERSRSLR